MSQKIGRLKRVDLREIWLTEASDFTPWLAQPENLEILVETLGIELELEAQEKSVGPFRADILCKDIGTDTWVLIENQLERTDHQHLGQLLTYASGLQAVTIVWIAARFTEEHRSTMDWLNKITDESFKFFGLEVELWKIGDSPAAPKFNVASKPNNWSRSVAQAAKAIEDTELSQVRLTQRKYWEGLHLALNNLSGPVSGNRKAQPQSWMNYSIGRTGFVLGAAMVRWNSKIRAELYITGPSADAYFRLLLQNRDAIEAEIGSTLEWEDLPERQDRRIAQYLEDTNPDNESEWPQQHDWLAQRLNAFHRVFSWRIRELNADDWKEEA